MTTRATYLAGIPRADAVRMLRADHVRRSRPGPLVWVDSRLERSTGGGFPVTGAWSFRETCEHHAEWSPVGEHWEQCRTCHWCRPVLGRPPRVERLPALLAGRVLPPLSGTLDLRAVYANAGFVVDAGRRSVLSRVRVRVVQYSEWREWPTVRRCGVEVRFRRRGWREAGVFMETWLHRLVGVLAEARPRRPRALWRAIQAAMGHRWPPPWEREQWGRIPSRGGRA